MVITERFTMTLIECNALRRSSVGSAVHWCLGGFAGLPVAFGMSSFSRRSLPLLACGWFGHRGISRGLEPTVHPGRYFNATNTPWNSTATSPSSSIVTSKPIRALSR